MPDLPEDAMNSLSVTINDCRHDADWQQQNPERYQAILARSNTRSAGIDEPGRETGARRLLEARIEHDTFARLPQLKLPVFIAGGAYDGVAPPANLEAINRQIEQSKLQFFQGGHDFYDHDPLAYQRITEFLQGKLDDR
jgi:3-oxoadipate enol-lactonase